MIDIAMQESLMLIDNSYSYQYQIISDNFVFILILEAD